MQWMRGDGERSLVGRDQDRQLIRLQCPGHAGPDEAERFGYHLCLSVPFSFEATPERGNTCWINRGPPAQREYFLRRKGPVMFSTSFVNQLTSQ